MKSKFSYILLSLVLLLNVSCNDILEEEPKGLLTAQFLESAEGVNAALYSAYSDLRYIYGGEGALSVTEAGTDEFQRGPDGNVNINMYGGGLAAEGLMGNTWSWGFVSINTTNAVIKFAPGSGIGQADADRIVAEAKYLRATWWFILVQTYGQFPLNKEFVESPSTEAFPSSVTEIYDAIVSDLEEAKLVLPAIAAQPGRATAAAAYHLLAKVYLTRASHNEARQASDYQQAYENAMHLIDNAGEYDLALLPDFADVHRPRNEHSTEILFTVERNTDIEFNDMDPDKNGNKNNRSSFFFRPNYSSIVNGLIRDIENGRPWHRVRPTNYLLEVTFAERENDTRYNKTFQTVWLVNDEDNVEDRTFQNGDTAIWLPGYEDYPEVKALRIFPPSQYYDNVGADGNKQTISIFPSMRKYDDIDRPTVGDASVRPFIVHRFAETYLIASEAAMYLGNASKSRELINVVRTRAAYDPNRSDAINANAVQRITTDTPSMTDPDEGIVFILEERSRELCGEYMRWWDLVRTKTQAGEVMLLKRIRELDPAIPARDNIQNFHVLRPIPQSQLDLTSNDYPQNEGY